MYHEEENKFLKCSELGKLPTMLVGVFTIANLIVASWEIRIGILDTTKPRQKELVANVRLVYDLQRENAWLPTLQGPAGH